MPHQAKGVLETVVVVVSLVHTIMDTFGRTSDLYKSLKKKQDKVKEDVEELKQRHGIPPGLDSSDEDSQRLSHRGRRRRRGRSTDYSDSDEESIGTSGALVRREYDRGYQHIGHKFAVGDVIAQSQLQAQVIAMQQTIITIFEESALMYGPRKNAISHHLAQLLNTTRAARAGSIEALAQQYQRMLLEAPVPPAIHVSPSVTTSQSSKTLTIRARPRADSKDSITTTNSGPTAITSRSAPHGLYCLYSTDLQEHEDQPLADGYREGGDGRCPYCRIIVNTRPGRAWELVKEDEKNADFDRVFRVGNRFVVKSHREGGKFACVLCTREEPSDTVCESIPALIDHVWKEHSCAEYVREIDIVEVD